MIIYYVLFSVLIALIGILAYGYTYIPLVHLLLFPWAIGALITTFLLYLRKIILSKDQKISKACARFFFWFAGSAFITIISIIIVDIMATKYITVEIMFDSIIFIVQCSLIILIVLSILLLITCGITISYYKVPRMHKKFFAALSNPFLFQLILFAGALLLLLIVFLIDFKSNNFFIFEITFLTFVTFATLTYGIIKFPKDKKISFWLTYSGFFICLKTIFIILYSCITYFPLIKFIKYPDSLMNIFLFTTLTDDGKNWILGYILICGVTVFFVLLIKLLVFNCNKKLHRQ
jgi:hypothetical protein